MSCSAVSSERSSWSLSNRWGLRVESPVDESDVVESAASEVIEVSFKVSDKSVILFDFSLPVLISNLAPFKVLSLLFAPLLN